MEENDMISTRISRSGTFHVEIFFTHSTEARTFQRGSNYAPIDLKCECDTLINARRYNGKKLHDIDKNLKFTHFSRRDIFTHGTEARTFQRGSNYAHTNLKCECDTLINARRCNGRKLHNIDKNLTFTHFSRKDIFDAWYRSEVILERAKVCNF